MIVFESQEAFDNAVVAALRSRLAVGVMVKKEAASYYGDSMFTKVEVALFDKNTGDDIDRGSDYA